MNEDMFKDGIVAARSFTADSRKQRSKRPLAASHWPRRRRPSYSRTLARRRSWRWPLPPVRPSCSAGPSWPWTLEFVGKADLFEEEVVEERRRKKYEEADPLRQKVPKGEGAICMVVEGLGTQCVANLGQGGHCWQARQFSFEEFAFEVRAETKEGCGRPADAAGRRDACRGSLLSRIRDGRGWPGLLLQCGDCPRPEGPGLAEPDFCEREVGSWGGGRAWRALHFCLD